MLAGGFQGLTQLSTHEEAKEKEWLEQSESTLHLKLGGNEKIVLLQLLYCLVFGGDSTLDRVLQSRSLQLLHLKTENLGLAH